MAFAAEPSEHSDHYLVIVHSSKEASITPKVEKALQRANVDYEQISSNQFKGLMPCRYCTYWQ